jgi:uncharacterized membrane protein YkoI
LLGICTAIPAAQAGAIITEPAAIAQASKITKQQAEKTALTSVGGGTVTLAVLEKDHGKIYWSIDITGSSAEYEVWVSRTTGKILQTITQPL